MVLTGQKSLHRLNPILSWLRSNKFYSSTPIGGFGLIDESKFKWEVTIWYLVLIVFTGLTIQNAYEIIGDYLGEPSITKTSIIETKMTNLSLSNFTLTIATPKSFLFASQVQFINGTNLRRRGRFRVAKNISAESETWAMWLQELEENLHDLMVSKDAFLNERWPQAVITAFILAECGDRNVLNITLRFIEDISSMNITGDEFYSKLSKELRHHYTLIIQPVNEHLKVKMGRISNFPLYFTGARCFGNEVKVFFYVHSKTKTTKLMIASLLSKDERNMYMSYKHKDQLTMTISNLDGGNVFTIDPGQPTQHFRIHVTGLFKSAMNCQEYRDYRDCEERCLYGMFAENCYCHPVSLPYRIRFALFPNNSMPLCSFEDHRNQFKRCISKTKLIKTWSTCRKTCRNTHPCYRLFTEYSNSIAAEKYPQTGDMVAFVELLKEGAFMSFSEEPKNTFTGFLAEIGGIFDVWIGASMIGFVHLIIYIIKQFVYVWNKKTKTGGRLRMMFKTFEPSALIVPSAVAMRMVNIAGVGKRSLEDEIAEIKDRIRVGQHIQMSELFDLIEKQQQQVKEQKVQLEKLQHEVSEMKDNA